MAQWRLRRHQHLHLECLTAIKDQMVRTPSSPFPPVLAWVRAAVIGSLQGIPIRPQRSALAGGRG
jgi:hypothetical protein